jgi:predicted phosphoribosyltransferase
MMFRDRRDAGRALSRQLGAYASRDDVIVLALPRGGVPVAYEIAEAIDAPLDVFLVRKLGMPGHEEYAMGAIASGGIRVVSEDIVRQIGMHELERVTIREERELRRRERLYRGDRPPIELWNRTVLLVDDGVATGASMQAAIAAVRQLGPRQIVVAVPVAPPQTARRLEEMADDVVTVARPQDFHAVGAFYEGFHPTSDAEVRALLSAAARRHGVVAEPVR